MALGQEFPSKKSFHCAKQQNNVALSGWDVWHCRCSLPTEISPRSIPVLVRGLENSCCRSLFSVVLKTTTMSAGRVSLFFSRNPFTLYMTCGVGHGTVKTQLNQHCQHSSIGSHAPTQSHVSYLSCVMLNPKAKLHAFRYPEIFAAQIVFKFIWRQI